MRDMVSMPVNRCIQSLSADVGFPVAECLWIGFVPILLAWVAWRRRRAIRPVAAVLACVCAVYAVVWVPVAATPILDVPGDGYTVSALNALATALIEDANAQKAKIPDALSPGTDATPEIAGIRVKFARYPSLMRKLGVAGVYFPWTGEVVVSALEPAWTIPFTMCHEVAHALGYGREDEANYIAYRMCMESDAQYRYSAQLTAIKYALSSLKRAHRGMWQERMLDMDEAVRADFRSMSGTVEAMTGFSDAFLRMTGQNGLTSYDGLIGYLLADAECAENSQKVYLQTPDNSL